MPIIATSKYLYFYCLLEMKEVSELKCDKVICSLFVLLKITFEILITFFLLMKNIPGDLFHLESTFVIWLWFRTNLHYE